MISFWAYRFCELGDVTLDLVHLDARVDGGWLGLDPREFEIFWLLAHAPGAAASELQLLRHPWRIAPDSETALIARLVASLRARLAHRGLASMLESDGRGNHAIKAPPGPSTFRFRRQAQAAALIVEG